MGAVFVVLILLALSIKVITLFDRENFVHSLYLSTKARFENWIPTRIYIAPVESQAIPDSVDLDSDSRNSDSITGQQVAAMAVAIALSDSGSLPTQPLTPVRRTSSPDAWLQSGRTRAMSSSRFAARDRRI